MHWAFPGDSTDEIIITRARDNSNTASVSTRSITPYLNTERPTATSSANAASCVLPDGTDPCLRANDKINIGYTNGDEVGWFWNVRQGGGFPFPHIRGARFDADSDPTLLDEPDIWNPNFAWIYPTVGVNDRGHVGLTAYEMGGGRFPKPAATLIDDIVPDTDWDSLAFHGIIASDSGVTANTWGDYQSVRPYGDCANTFAGSVQSMQGGTTGANAEHRFAWFGRARDACPDLAVTTLTHGSTARDPGAPVNVSHEIQNTGSGAAPASTTGFYFSRDASKSDDDLRAANVSALGQLQRAGLSGLLATTITAPRAFGTWYVIACADDLGAYDEISDTNNCKAADDTVVVGGIPAVTEVDLGSSLMYVPAGGRLPVELQLHLPTRARASRAQIYLAPQPAVGQRMRHIGSVSSPRNLRDGSTRATVRRILRLPRSAPPARRQFLVACLGTRPRADRCVISRRPLFVTRANVRRRSR